jgi:DNA-directed RNA polymerase alpha subunit
MDGLLFDELNANTILTLNRLDKEACEKAIELLKQRVKLFNQNLDYLTIEIEDLPLSIRAANALRNRGLQNVKDVVLFGLDSLFSIRNLGTGGLKEIQAVFKKLEENKHSLKYCSRDELKEILTR